MLVNTVGWNEVLYRGGNNLKGNHVRWIDAIWTYTNRRINTYKDLKIWKQTLKNPATMPCWWF